MNQKEYDSVTNTCFEHITELKGIASKIKSELLNLYETYNMKQYNNKSLGIEAIEKSPETDMSLEQLSANSYTSKYQYIRSFKKAVGVTPHNFIILRRIRKAQKLLDNGSSVANAAVSSGFYDQSHLDKYFKMIVGISPNEYSRSVITKCN